MPLKTKHLDKQKLKIAFNDTKCAFKNLKRPFFLLIAPCPFLNLGGNSD